MTGSLLYTDGQGNTDMVSPKQVAQLDAACATNKFNGAAVCPWGAGADPNMLSYYANVPVATGAASGDGLNSGSFFFPSPAPFTQNTSILKIDYNLNSANRIFVRGNLQKDTAAGAENLPGQPPASFTDDNTKGIAAGYTWTPTATIVNDLRYGFIRQGYQKSGVGTGDYVVVLDLTQPTAQTRNNILHVPVHNITDTLSWSKGAHTLAFGGNWRGITVPTPTPSITPSPTLITPMHPHCPTPAPLDFRRFTTPALQPPGWSLTATWWVSSHSSMTFTTSRSTMPPPRLPNPTAPLSIGTSAPMSSSISFRTPGRFAVILL
jgi:hypothetical protein